MCAGIRIMGQPIKTGAMASPMMGKWAASTNVRALRRLANTRRP